MGSVRAARERLEAGDVGPRLAGPSNDYQSRTQNQWPLLINGQNAPPQSKGAPPQRPPRPSYVPSILDNSKVKEQMVSYNQSQQSKQPILQQAKYWEPNYVLSPQTPGTPGTGISSSSSRDSAGSSVGSIPDFPVPAIPINPPPPIQSRRIANLGPPPSSRRGASSYYSSSSFVAPIPEESMEMMHQPGLHSPMKPSNAQAWLGNDSYYGSEIYDDEIDDRETRSPDHDESSGLVRQASLGKQYKPSLTTVNQRKGHSPPKLTAVDQTALANETMVFVESIDADEFDEKPRVEESMEEALLRENTTSSSTGSSRSLSPSEPVDPRIERIIGGLEKGGAIASGTTPPNVSSPPLSPTPRRPPPIDMDRVKQAESRGSLTSLTDLIRRATKVKSNLERGRTASRLGMLDFFSSSNPNLLIGKNDQPRNSLSDMLNSFPPPAVNTPTREGQISRWPSPFVNSNPNLTQSVNFEDKEEKQPRRRCCGLPLWGFLLVLLVLFLLIAAAVVIPVVLIVLPRLNSTSPPSPDPLANCASSTPCSNGGISVISSNSCRCICTNGFTGANCATFSATAGSGCTTSTVGSFRQATLGSAIPHLFSGASSNFSVPLNTTALLSDFSASQLSCSDENNLVTFSTTPQRRHILQPVEAYEAPLPLMTLAPRIPVAVAEAQAPVTSNGIVFDSPTTTAPNLATTGATAGPTPTPSVITPSTFQMDFARVAILFILQETQLNTTVYVHQQLDSHFSRGNFDGPIIIQPNITVDLHLLKVTVGDTTVGSTNSSRS